MRLPAWLLGSFVLVAACSVFGGSQLNSWSCGDVPQGACEDQARQIAAGLPGITDLEIECTVLPCTRAGGAGTAHMTLANGQRVTRAWSYVGDPGPAPAPVCIGLQPSTCKTQADGWVDSISPSKHVVSVTVTCTKAPCTDASGEVDIKVLLGDGSLDTTSSGWNQ
jgi:hypothetical protein